MNDLIGSAVFWVLSLLIIGTALGVVMSKNLVHSALLLTACFIGTGILYITLEADFLGAVEFMTYSGGVAVLIVMGVMLTHKGEGLPSNPFNGRELFAAALAVVFAAVMGLVLTFVQLPPDAGFVSADTVGDLAEMMLSTYILPFEIAAVLLLAALLGAIILAKGDGEA
ncbi:MAG: NADH-quinone oxidoreductase subunit J [Anaerovibrio sp.]